MELQIPNSLEFEAAKAFYFLLLYTRLGININIDIDIDIDIDVGFMIRANDNRPLSKSYIIRSQLHLATSVALRAYGGPSHHLLHTHAHTLHAHARAHTHTPHTALCV